MRKLCTDKDCLAGLDAGRQSRGPDEPCDGPFQPQLEQCELCVSQAQLQSAIPCQDNLVSIDTDFNAQPFDLSRQAIPATPIIFQRQRAPPVSFS